MRAWILVGVLTIGMAGAEAAGQVNAGRPEGGGDAWITTKIQAAYFLDADVKARHVDVTTRDGVVTLSGTVHSGKERDQAVSIARTTDGVKQVVDKLVVRPDATVGTTGSRPEPRAPGTDELSRITESDPAILTQIKTRLALDNEVNAFSIDVDVSDGKVTLQGTVPTELAHQRALTIARNVRGVKSVVDKITVRP
jgi:hyperosmotically inducible protein